MTSGPSMRGGPARMHAPGHRLRTRRESGVALLLVLWAMALLALLLAQLLGDARLESRTARLRLDQARGELAAQGGIAFAVAGLLDARPARRWLADGRPYRLQNGLQSKLLSGSPSGSPSGGASLTVRAWSEKGKVDLNAASVPMLRQLFMCAGDTAAHAARVADEVADWRASAGGRTADRAADSGAGSADPARNAYRAAGRVDGPREAPMQRPDELRQVLDMSPALFDAVSGAVTVWSGMAEPEPSQAAPLALCAARGLPLPQARAAVAERWAHAATAAGGAESATETGPLVSIESEATLANGSRVGITAVLLLRGAMGENTSGGANAAPYLILDWKEV